METSFLPTKKIILKEVILTFVSILGDSISTYQGYQPPGSPSRPTMTPSEQHPKKSGSYSLTLPLPAAATKLWTGPTPPQMGM